MLNSENYLTADSINDSSSKFKDLYVYVIFLTVQDGHRTLPFLLSLKESNVLSHPAHPKLKLSVSGLLPDANRS
jgi:hypothetical protein